MNQEPQTSFESHMRKLALKWTIAGVALALGLSGSVFYLLQFNDAESQIETMASTAIASHRTNILTGDVRTIELQLQKDLRISSGESVFFLDPQMQRWIRNAQQTEIETCPKKQLICRDLFRKKTGNFIR